MTDADDPKPLQRAKRASQRFGMRLLFAPIGGARAFQALVPEMWSARLTRSFDSIKARQSAGTYSAMSDLVGRFHNTHATNTAKPRRRTKAMRRRVIKSAS